MSLSPGEFYENIADGYDEMTRFRARLKSEKAVMKEWMERYPMQSALDAACGSGLHSILLAKLGVRVTGADISAGMLEQARRNAAAEKAEVRFIHSPMQQLKQTAGEKYDAVFCMGNSLPHLTDEKSLAETLHGFAGLLSPDGVVILQLLNYTRILAGRQRIIGVNRSGEREFIRFYDFLDKTIRFNILSVDWRYEKATPHLSSTELYPYRKNELEQALREKGLTVQEIFGDMKFSNFDEASSPNLVLVAGKK